MRSLWFSNVAFFALLIAHAASAADVDWDAMIPAIDIRADFQALYTGLQAAHADLYAQRSEAAYDRRYEQTLASFTKPMSRFDVQLAFQRFAAYGNIAHARIEFPVSAFDAFRAAGGKTFPVYPRIVEGIAYVGENYSGNERIRLGDEIVAIDGTPMSTWLERTAAHISADTSYIAHSLMEFTFPRDLWAVVGQQAQYRLTLRRNNQLKTVTINASTQAEQRAVAEGTPAGFTLNSNARTYRMLSDELAYLQPGPFYNVEQPDALWDPTSFIAFIDQAFEHFIEQDAKALIIDLRQNPGGDNSFSDPMLAWIAEQPFRFYAEFLVRSSDAAAAANQERLATREETEDSVSSMFARQYASVPRGEVFSFELPHVQPREGERFEGQVYALVNRHSYSNAVNVAAIIQDYQMGLIVGEKTADMATTYGSMETFVLPQTGIRVGFPKAHIIRPSRERKPDGVTPDWVIPSPVVAPKDDVVLEALRERIAATLPSH